MPASKGRSKEKSLSVNISMDTLLRIVLVVGAVALLYFLWNIVLMFLIAILLAALIDPFADRLEAKKIPRGFAVAFIYLVILSLATTVLLLVVPPTLDQLSGIVATYGDRIELVGIDQSTLHALTSGEWLELDFDEVLRSVQESGLLQSVPVAVEVILQAFNVVLSIVVVIILSFYMVIEERELKKGVVRWLTPLKYRNLVLQVMPKVREKLGFWLRGQLTIMLIVGLLVFIVLTVLGVPFALVLAITAGVLEIVPFIGPFLSVVPAIIVALSVSPLQAVLVGIFYFLVQQFEGDFLTPQVMHKVAGLNPVASIISILVGWELAGIAGALFAIPIAMVVGIFLNEWFSAKEKAGV